MKRLLLVLAAAVVLAAPAAAQYPQGSVGFALTTNLGNSAGGFCHWFSCTPAPVNLTAGEVVTLLIRGEYQGAYVLGASTSATSCVAYPGIFHNLVIDLPVTIVMTGTLANGSPALACPNGYTEISSIVPPGIPLGSTLAIQALTSGAGNVLSFTGAILVTII